MDIFMDLGLLRYNGAMKKIRRQESGAAVEDVQQRLATLHYLEKEQITGYFDDATAEAVKSFCADYLDEMSEEVDGKVWAALVDASFNLGDRTLYLRMPYFHGNDVVQLQQALSALGFVCGAIDGIFGAYTELALRKFQLNLGLPSDGIAGAFTYASFHSLQHSWEGKDSAPVSASIGFARAADMLEEHALCVFGTEEFTRSVASRMSNLALATNPASKIVSADSLLVAPDESMLLIHVVLPKENIPQSIPRVSYEEEKTLSLRLQTAIKAAASKPPRVALELPGVVWEDAGAGRSAQHFAITVLDALCSALSNE